MQADLIPPQTWCILIAILLLIKKQNIVFKKAHELTFFLHEMTVRLPTSQMGLRPFVSSSHPQILASSHPRILESSLPTSDFANARGANS
jgi:hypothetical protein